VDLAAIRDPFEQALFIMVQLPYLQPFDDLNKRVSRLAVRGCFTRGGAFNYLANWAEENIDAPDREPFRVMAENELLNFHEGNFARYQIRPTEFAAWQAVWKPR
jgi:hypothetical protein